MRVSRTSPLVLGSDAVNDGQRLRVSYTNQGEPYREGCELSLEIPCRGYGQSVAHVFLETREVVALRDWLNKFTTDVK